MAACLEALFFMLCSTLPVHWLAYYPFWKLLRFPKAAAIGLFSVTLLVKAAFLWLAVSHGIDPNIVEYLFAPIHLAVYLVNVRVQPFKLVFTYILLMDYVMMVKGISAFAVVGLLEKAPGSYFDSAVCLLLFALTVPAMLRFFQSASQRVYRINAPVWNTIWIVPAFISGIVLVFTREFTPENVRQWPFLLTRLGLLVCIFVIYHILLLALESFQKQAMLEAQRGQMERVLALQKEQYALLKSQGEETRRFRHDLRQKLIAAQQELAQGQTEKLAGQLNILLGSLPAGAPRVCPNDAVNAVALYHQAAARRAGVSAVTLHLESLPEVCTAETESDLCVLTGNLLENAVTACKGTKQPFIAMQSRMADGILTLTMDNRFSAVRQTPDGAFLSTRPGGGIGLLSIRSIAEKYGGGCRFEAKETVFSSSVYLRLPSEISKEIPASRSLR